MNVSFPDASSLVYPENPADQEGGEVPACTRGLLGRLPQADIRAGAQQLSILWIHTLESRTLNQDSEVGKGGSLPRPRAGSVGLRRQWGIQGG